ncbi:hypothetical protein [Streptomyces cacaoi]|uniref:hypothetical protein n=1 Tax=Streptomyces cacaoi TaxID=1898 RepID=UPI0037495AF2
MTQPTAPPPTAPPPAPAAGGAAPDPGQPPGRGGARDSLRPALERLRAAATTEPGRLRAIGAVLAALLVLSGAVTAWQAADRVAAADAVRGSSQPLSADAARIYRSLAHADTAASSGFLAADAGDTERPEVREDYEKDIAEASGLLAKAAANSGGSGSARRQIADLNRELPVYTGLVETARANNRQGLPLGGAYLRHANQKMRDELLPAAKKLYSEQNKRLGRDDADTTAWPYPALAVGLVALGALGWAQRRHFRRTNRVFSPGLLGATAACLASVVWLGAGQALVRSGMDDAQEKGARSLHALNEAWIGALQARGFENMTLVARGGGAAYESSYTQQMEAVAGGRAAEGGKLHDALTAADDAEGRSAVRSARGAVVTWQQRHTAARAEDDGGNYDGAVERVIGAKGSTDVSFRKADRALEKAVAHEQQQFEAAADGARSWLVALPAGALVLAVLGAVAALAGVGRRIGEYR